MISEPGAKPEVYYRNEAVIFIHGIWLKGYELYYLSRYLNKLGYQTYHFKYKSLFRTPAENADLLNTFLKKIEQPVAHMVSHSLGGIVLLHLFHRHPLQQPGKIIMLGTPLNGSAVAKHIYQRPWLRWLLGKSTEQGLLGDAPSWASERDVYMIAGKKGIGMGLLLAFRALKKPNDGTVNFEETMTSYIKQHIDVPYTHFSMLWSRKVAEKIRNILVNK